MAATKTRTRKPTTKKPKRVIEQVECKGGQESHEAQMRANGECPWCGAADASKIDPTMVICEEHGNPDCSLEHGVREFEPLTWLMLIKAIRAEYAWTKLTYVQAEAMADQMYDAFNEVASGTSLEHAVAQYPMIARYVATSRNWRTREDRLRVKAILTGAMVTA